MTPNGTGTLDAGALRREFDEAFARPSASAAEAQVPHLLLRVGLDPQTYAVALSEVLQVSRINKLVNVPTSLGSLLGLVSVRSAVVPIYGMATLLGLAQEPPRWFALHGSQGDPVGFAFGQFEGYVEVSPSELLEGQTLSSSRRLIQTAAGAHGVLELGALVNVIRGQIGAPRVNKEK